MKVKKIVYREQEGLMVFISLEEKNNEEIRKQIEDYKKSYKDVSIFISGNNNIEKALEAIIQEKMEKNNL